MREPVLAEDLTGRALSVDWLSSRAGAVWWVESSAEAGDAVLMSRPAGGGSATPVAEGVGNGLHAYGAHPYAVTSGGVVVTRPDDGQVWDVTTNARLTEVSDQHGDLHVDLDRVCCVRETGEEDQLLVIDPATGAVDVVHRAPFLAAPRLRGHRLAWTQWGDDVMPWDAAEIWAGTYRPGRLVVDAHRIAGGRDEAAHQPQWGPDGHLYLLTDRTGWWNLHRWAGAPRSGDLHPVAPVAAECGAAPWEAGYSSYTFLRDGRIAIIAENGPRGRILLADAGGKVDELVTPFTSFKPFLAPTEHGLAVLGATPGAGPRVADLHTDGSGTIEIIRSGGPPPYAAPIPQLLTVESAEPLTVLVHPAVDHHATPPLIVRAHPGPTDNNRLRLDEEVQFFTSRGYTVAEVDYRGSTGYGRHFRTVLNGRWGELDVEDCITVATHLITIGRARADAVFITGASAGAYTALRAVSRPDTPFALAVARSAIVHPNRWARTAPRFQRAHAATLAHRAADVDPAAVCRPVLLIHGSDDTVAPPSDAVELARALRARDLLVDLVDLPGVGHYLSGPALITALGQELAAYEKRLVSLTP